MLGGFFSRLFGSKSSPDYVEDWSIGSDRRLTGNSNEPVEVRRWDGSMLGDVNFSHVTGRSINEDLVWHLPVLVDRCSYEASINPTIAGAIDAQSSALVSPGGPTWVCAPKRPVDLPKDEQKSLSRYLAEAESILQEWFAEPSHNGDQSGAMILQQIVFQQFTCGNGFTQIVNGRGDGVNPIRLRLAPIHAARVLKNVNRSTAAGENVCLGIVRDSFGKPTKYLVAEPGLDGSFSTSIKSIEVPASQMIHSYLATEPGQIAGFPLLAPALGTIADLRAFDEATQNAATLAAKLSVVFVDKDDKTPVFKGGSQSVKIGAQTFMHAPRGKDVKQLSATHPGAQYVEYTNERWRSVGRAIGIPLMVLRQNSQEHSYSGSRQDMASWVAALQKEQWAIERRMAPILLQVLREAELRKLIAPAPVPVSVSGIWSPVPGADPYKDALSTQINLSTMSTTLLDVWQANGHRPQEMISKLKRSIDSLEEVQPGLGQTFISNMFKNPDLAKGVEFSQLIEQLEASAAQAA